MLESEVFITTRDMVAEIRRDLKEVVTKTDLIEHEIREMYQLVDHEDRLRGLERWRYGIPPALLLSLGTLVAALLR